MALSPDGTQLAVSGPSGQVTLWDTYTGRAMGILDGHDFPVTGIAYGRTGELLATSAADGVRMWDAATGALITNLIDNDLPLRVASGWYTDVEFSPRRADDRRIPSGPDADTRQCRGRSDRRGAEPERHCE